MLADRPSWSAARVKYDWVASKEFMACLLGLHAGEGWWGERLGWIIRAAGRGDKRADGRSAFGPPSVEMQLVSKKRGTVRPRKISLRALIAALVGCLVLTAALLALLRGSPPEVATVDADAAAQAPASEPPAADATTLERREQVVEDTNEMLLWESPTSGPPISLEWTPAGAQCFVHLRPAALIAHGEGERVLAGLGSWGRDAVDRLRAATGAELTEIDAVLVSIVEGVDGKLDACLRVELVKPWDDAELARRFPNGREAKLGKSFVRIVDDRARWLADQASRPGHTLVVCPQAIASELIDSGGESPPLVRDLESLVAHADTLRDVTIIFSPRFLQAGGSGLVAGDAAPLRDGLLWLVDRDATAAAVSAHWDADFFVELRAAPALSVPPRRLAARLRERVAELPSKIDAVIDPSSRPPYGRNVLERLPAMLRTLAELTRSGDDDRLAVLNCYLPAPAGHNLLTATELLLTLPPGEAASAAGQPTGNRPQSIEDLLTQPTSLSFPKDSLQRALELLADDLGVPVVIAGADLQLDGITQNQSLSLNMRNRPAGEILVEILRRANPDRTAAGPADPRQKLVYVIEPPTGDGPGRIIVTTRSAAEKRGLALPAVFGSAGR